MNHDYNVPDRGEIDWDILLNENFRRLDADVEIRDEAASRDEYEPKEGAKFLAIDTGAAYVGDGEQWRSLPTISTTPEFDAVSTTQVTLEERGNGSVERSRPLVSVESRTITVGPEEDDDSKTIQAALDTVPFFLRHNYTIEVDPAGDPYGPLVVPAVFPVAMAERGKGDTAFLRIAGNDGQDAGEGAKSRVEGVYIGNGENALYLRDVELVGENPHDNLSSCLTAFGGTGHLVSHVAVGETPATYAFHAQNGAYLDVRHCNLGDVNVESGCLARGAETTIQARDFSGSVEEDAYVGYSGYIYVRQSSVDAGGARFVADRALVYDTDEGTLYGPTSLGGARG